MGRHQDPSSSRCCDPASPLMQILDTDRSPCCRVEDLVVYHGDFFLGLRAFVIGPRVFRVRETMWMLNGRKKCRPHTPRLSISLPRYRGLPAVLSCAVTHTIGLPSAPLICLLPCNSGGSVGEALEVFCLSGGTVGKDHPEPTPNN